MMNEIDALERKLEQVLALLGSLHAENEALKVQLHHADSERSTLRQAMEAARERLERLMEKLPEDA